MNTYTKDEITEFRKISVEALKDAKFNQCTGLFIKVEPETGYCSYCATALCLEALGTSVDILEDANFNLVSEQSVRDNFCEMLKVPTEVWNDLVKRNDKQGENFYLIGCSLEQHFKKYPV